jgi:hypothetical membrane protein
MQETKFHHIVMYLTFFSLGMLTTAIAITQGFFQEFVFVLLAGALFLVFSLAYHYVRGIDYMQENHPDYKGEDLFDEGETESKL